MRNRSGCAIFEYMQRLGIVAATKDARDVNTKVLEKGENEKNTHKCNFMLDYNEIREQIKCEEIDSFMR